MNVAWLEVFREVAARGSLTAAGQALGYTQSTVSRQLSALEKATGARLFDRLPRGVRLTEEGRCLLAHAEAVLGRMHAAQQALAALRDLDAGRPGWGWRWSRCWPQEPPDPMSCCAPLHPDDAPVRSVHAATWRGVASPPPVAAFLQWLDATASELRTAARRFGRRDHHRG